MPSLLDVLGYAGNALDLPGSSVRDLLTGNNPFDQWLTPFSEQNRATGRDVLNPIFGANEETGMSGWLDNPMEGVKDFAGFGAEMLLDPTNLIPGRAILKALKGRKAAKATNKLIDAENLANAGRYAMVNPKVMSQVDNPMKAAPNWMDRVASFRDDQDSLLLNASLVGGLEKAGYVDEYEALGRQAGRVQSENQRLLGYTPERETVFHGGHDWTASATPEYPYGMYDTSRAGIGEGGQMYGPGFYVADDPNVSKYYQGMVQEDLTKSAKESPMYQLRNVLDDYTDAFNEPVELDQIRKFFQDESDNPIMAKAGTLFNILDKNEYFGADPNDLFFWDEMQDALTSPKKLEEYVGSANPKEVQELLNFTADKYGGAARLYQLDMPTGSKERFLKWEAPLSEQPEAVRNLIDDPQKLISKDQWAAIDEAKGYSDTLDELLAREDEIKRTPSLKYLNPIVQEQIREVRDNLANIRKDLLQQGVPWDIAHGRFEDMNMIDGEAIADLMMGKMASDATLAEASGLRKAGVPGTSNQSMISSSTRNYAIWDQDLINQMRIRAIDGERVPINPTTLVQQLAVPARRGAADDMLEVVANPMREKMEVPNALKPVVAGAVFNLLARQNNYGGAL